MNEDHQVQRYVDAVATGDEPQAHDVLVALSRCSPARVAVRLLAWLVDPRPLVCRAVSAAARSTLGRAPIRSLWAMDRALRDRGRGAPRGVPREYVRRLASGDHGLGALALLSMQRHGYTRQDAVLELAGRSDPLVLRLLLLRLNDPVSDVAQAALGLVWPWIELHRAPSLVGVLPLLETMGDTVRAGHSGVMPRVERLLGSGAESVRRALVAAAHGSPDDDVRISATRRLIDGPVSDGGPALRRALGDRSPRVRHAVARFIARSSLREELRRAVLPALHDNASPSLRLLSLRLRETDDSAATTTALLERSFDANAVVRYHARRMLRERGDASDFYALARARLHAPGLGPRALVGVLAVLSDIGRRSDIEDVRRVLTDHPTGRVATEARRTLEILEQG